MTSLKKIKKTVKSIRQFVKAFTRSSRDGRNVSRRLKEDRVKLLQEEPSEQDVSTSSSVEFMQTQQNNSHIIMGGAQNLQVVGGASYYV